MAGPAHAIAPNTPITNTGVASFSIGDAEHRVEDAHTIVTDPSAGNSPPYRITLDGGVVPPNVAGAPVGPLAVFDPDEDDAHTLSVSDPRFDVVGGVLVLADDSSLPPGTTVLVTVTATDPGGLSYEETFEVTTSAPVSPGASINILHVGPGGTNADVGLAECLAGGVAQPVGAVSDVFGSTLPLPGVVSLTDAAALKSGGTVFFEVQHAPANVDAVVRDQLDIEVRLESGDAETLRLIETASDSGIFVGYAQLERGLAVPEDCRLQGALDDALTATYDTDGGGALVTDQVRVDPLGRVFASDSGRLVDDVLVQLVDADTGELVQVFSEDGRTSFPAAVRTGTRVQDGAGETFDLPTGTFRFPYVAPGAYRLDIAPPHRFRFPSTVVDRTLQALPGAPFELSAASRGNLVMSSGGALLIDVPLDLAPNEPTPAVLEPLVIDPSGPQVTLPAGVCAAAVEGVSAGALPMSAGISPANRFLGGEPIVVRVTDPDEDDDPFALDRVSVVLETGTDREQITLIETGVATGIFVGLVNSGGDTGVDDCHLGGDPGAEVQIRYTDDDDADDVQVVVGVLDPVFTVFSSVTGAPIDGARVQFVDAVTGNPAAGFAADGLTSFPTDLISGGSATDGGGAEHRFAPGTVRIPRLSAGEYAVTVTPPEGFDFPSIRTDAQIVAAVGERYRLDAGSRGERFVQASGRTVAFDIPLDPSVGSLFLSKSASEQSVGVGDFVQYLVTLQPSGGSALLELTVVDNLPEGFRYQPGSAKLDGFALPDPAISASGRELRFALGDLMGDSALELRYVVEVTVGADEGAARNRVTATGPNLQDVNVAFADVLVREELFSELAFLLGRVTDSCDPSADGVSGVRVLLEDGSFAVTDATGRYHFADLAPGTHVVQLDPASIPPGFKAEPCRLNSRNRGDRGGQFTELRPGGLWQENFRLIPKSREGLWTTQLHAHAKDGALSYQFDLVLGDVPVERGSVTVLLGDNATFKPDSARLGGVKLAPRVDGQALTFLLPRLEAQSLHKLAFEVQPSTSEAVTTRASAWLTTPYGKFRSEPVASTLSALPGDERLYVIAEGDSLEASVDVRGRSRAYEPVDRGARRSSEVVQVNVPLPPPDIAPTPYTLPDIAETQMPEFDLAWLSQAPNGAQMVWPPERFNPRTPAVTVVIKHPQVLRPTLLVDGKLVAAVNFNSTTSDPARQLSVSRWDNVPISEQDSQIEAQLLDAQGRLQARLARDVHFSQMPARAEVVLEQSYLVADGVHPPVIAVRLHDRYGHPARPGLSGEFSVRQPYRALDEARALEVVAVGGGADRYQVRKDGIVYIQLEPTSDAGDVELLFQFDRHRVERLRARLAPGERPWVLVGLLESSVTMLSADKAGLEDGVVHDGRAAFYAKGLVKGEWLLTAAYDSDKASDHEIKRAIDPNRYYTLYGDGTEQRQDAQSQRKLYVKLERRDLALEVGDFDTALDRGEFVSYERTLNGLRASYHGERIRAKAFASDTDQAFELDTLPGDGTSGVYRLSRSRLVMNSETLRIVTRDRFHPERVLSEQTLARHLDYAIDYDAGTVLFKQPIQAHDVTFNPVTIEARYEVASGSASDTLTAGGRVGIRIGEGDDEIGVTMLHDESSGVTSELIGVDAQLTVGQGELALEAAQSSADGSGDGQAMRAEYRYRAERLAGRAYYRQVDGNFGVGQQTAVEVDTRRFGVAGEYVVNESLLLRGEAFQQETLSVGGERAVALMEAQYRRGTFNLHGGVQRVDETTAAGQARVSDLVTLGAGTTLFDGRLLLRTHSEVAVSNAEVEDYPSRATLGAEYSLWNDVTLIAEHEIGIGDVVDTQDTRFGLRARPWTGSRVESYLGREMTESGERVFATTGLIQQFKLNERWMLDVGADRVQTISGAPRTPVSASFNPAQPPAGGSYDNDFTAAFVGAGYRREQWDASARVEFHSGDQADKWNFLFGAARQLSEGKAVSASAQWLDETRRDGGIQETGRLRLGVAWRPRDDAWLFLNRVDLETARSADASFQLQSNKVVANLHANRLWAQHELSLHLGARFVTQQFDGDRYSGTTAVLASDYRYDLSERWDVGAHIGLRRSMNAGVDQYSYGVSVGRAFFGNAWATLGYNFAGFEDADFSDAAYRQSGPYLKFRMRIDQQLVGRLLTYVGWRQDDGEVPLLARGGQ